LSESEKTGETDLDIDELIEIVSGAGADARHGPKIGRITAIGEAPDFVDVQPISGKIVAGVPRLDPILRSVPVAWPGSAQGRITWGLAIGDKVELIPQAADLSSWIQSEAETPSTNQRSLSLSDVLALPQSPTSKANPLPSEAYQAAAVTIFAAVELLLGDNTATSFVALADLVGNNDSALQSWLDNHMHDGSTIIAPVGGGACSGITGVPVTAPATPDPSPTPGDTSASKVKAI
jgi:hypothetical protein